APAERRQVFRSELQRVGTAGAKVLRELGNKVRRMEKLGSADILNEVHEAAEELQKKVDRKSYLLVNAEDWEIGKPPKEVEDPQQFFQMDDDEITILEYKSQSETILDFRSISTSRSWDDRNFNMDIKYIPPVDVPSNDMYGKQTSLPSQISHKPHAVPEQESKTYESASILSLATFTSLLIEFVARLQNLVDSFEELSEKAKFKEPNVSPAEAEEVGLWTSIVDSFEELSEKAKFEEPCESPAEAEEVHLWTRSCRYFKSNRDSSLFS
ncbi:hypothetical protein RJ639_024527, partial [Escallonia herrerae]